MVSGEAQVVATPAFADIRPIKLDLFCSSSELRLGHFRGGRIRLPAAYTMWAVHPSAKRQPMTFEGIS